VRSSVRTSVHYIRTSGHWVACSPVKTLYSINQHCRWLVLELRILDVQYSNADHYDRGVLLQFQCTKVTLQFTVQQAAKAQRGSRGIALLFLYPRRYMGVAGQRHVLATLPLEKRPGTHCIGGWVGLRVCLDGYGKSRSPPGFDLRTSSP